ncbi:MAG: sensor histidine kinase [Geminicoccaceae bacterium]|nr:sensor histidine kinase [Geminicoccaceae bacterium]
MDRVLREQGSWPGNKDWREIDRLRAENLVLKAELIEARHAPGRKPDEGADGQERPSDPTGDPRATAAAPHEAGRRLRQMAWVSELLNDTLRERDALIERQETRLREMSHRIKNDLQFVASLLRVQAREATGAEAADTLALAGMRIEAVAKVHDLLCAAPGTERVALERYLGEVCASLAACLGADGRHRRLVVEAEPQTLPARTAQCLGLLVSELVTNAFRHAFAPDAPGTVRVRSARDPDGRLTLTVADDGEGLPDGFAFGIGTGSGLVAALAKQAGASIAATREGGACFVLTVDA